MREVVARSLREIVIGRARGLLDKAKCQFANDAQDEAKRSLYLQTPAEALVAGRSEKGLVYYKRGCAVEGDHGGLTAKGWLTIAALAPQCIASSSMREALFRRSRPAAFSTRTGL